MLFSSFVFIFLFLPATLLIYYAVPVKYRNLALLILSLIFYAWRPEERKYLILLVSTFSIDYAAGWLIARFKLKDQPKKAKITLILAIILNLGSLVFFKYTDFMIRNIASIPAFSSLQPLGIAFPLGISFYTFQALSYVIDIYRGKVQLQKNYIKFGTYVVLFPQLVAGPIIRYSDIEHQLNDRPYSVPLFVSGIRTFVCGLTKKVVLANTAGALWTQIYQMPDSQLTTLLGWLGLFMFSMQIYFDFSGYSDMAIGLGKMLGFSFPENFNYPYISKSITDFWRRWHISLSTWFKEYVYIPLGGNRVKIPKMYLNLFIVWVLTGFWHGAAWNFLLWGLYFFVILAVEKLFLGKLLEKTPTFVRHGYAILMIMFGWLIFAFDGSDAGLTLPAFGNYFKTLFGFSGAGFTSGLTAYEWIRNMIFSMILIAACLPGPKQWLQKLKARYVWAEWVENILCILGLALCIGYLADSSFNPFLYWKF